MEKKALMAGVTVLLSHICGNLQMRANALDHQRPQDLATLARLIRSLEEISCGVGDNSDCLLLTRLASIEEQVASRAVCISFSMLGKSVGGLNMSMNADERLELPIPYFGTIVIHCWPVDSPPLPTG